MNRTILSVDDIKNIISYIFNGNLEASKKSGNTIPYKNNNSEKILLIDEFTGKQQSVDIAEYLNIKFYSWKERLESKSDLSISENEQFSAFDVWVQSLNLSLNEAFALVETLDQEITASQDIDSNSIQGRITFLIQTNKIANLDYYVSKLRNSYIGVPQTIQNSFGKELTAFIRIGALNFEQDPITTQLGETMVVTCNFELAYMNSALTYNDTKVEISLTGDDEYDENGEIIGTTKYLTMPITKITWQNIFTSTPVSTTTRPDLTGFVSSAISCVKTISFFDFNETLTMQFNDLFWKLSAYRINGIEALPQNVNIPVYIRITTNENTYVYKDMIDNMQKTLVNTDFNVSSITLKGWGILQQSDGGTNGTSI